MTIDDRQAGTRIDPLASANDLLQARLQGRISRRQLLRRATQLGLAAPVIGVLLHATGDAAFGALRQEATPVAVTGRTEPVGTPLEGGTLTIGIVGAIGTAAPSMVDDALNPFGAIQPAFLEGLLAFDNQQRIRPGLAESYEIADERAALYAELQKLLRDEVPVIFLFWDKLYPAATDRLGGFWPSAYTQFLWNARQWYLTEE